MSDGMDLINAMDDISKEIDETIDRCEKQGIILAEAEKEYQVLMRQKALKERAEGVPITFIAQFVKGDTEIAEKRFKRDTAEVRYNTLQERVRSLKLQLSVINSQATREWTVRSSDY